jgi:hypothetical protein
MSGPVDLGQTWRYRQTVTDDTGTPADAGTVTAVITLPDGTSSGTLTLTHAGTGLYDLAYATTLAGLHTLRTTATGGVLAAQVDVWEDVFTVETAGGAFVAVDEAAAHLRAAGIITSAADREQLRWLCLAASTAVEGDLGRVIAPRQVVEAHDGGKTAIVLRSTPLISVTSVVESGTTLTTADYVASTATGILYRGTQQSPSVWAAGTETVTVMARVGYTVPPRVARKVALGVVERAWQASQQAPHDALDAGGEVFAAVGTLTDPERAAYDALRSPGIA